MSKGHFNKTAFIKARVAQSVQCQATNLKVVGSSPTVGKNFFLFRILSFPFSVAFDALRAVRLVPYK